MLIRLGSATFASSFHAERNRRYFNRITLCVKKPANPKKNMSSGVE